MDYFERTIPQKVFLDKTIEEIDASLENFYKSDYSADKNIRLHSSTLGKDELIAFNKAYLEGNITVGKYNDQYEKMAGDYFMTNFAVTSNSGSSANLLFPYPTRTLPYEPDESGLFVIYLIVPPIALEP